MLKTGTVLDGKYKILNVIGRGGMSVVYLAINERANKTWAVKEVRKDGSNDFALVRRNLAAETEMLKKLDHPNLPAIVDVIDQGDSMILVMDYIEGRSLQDLLDSSGRQPPELVLAWAEQLCDVLAYLHSRQPPIIYRDMKPANIILRPNGMLSLIDFGTAREYKEEEAGDTVWLGTRGYAAPEQFGKMGQTDARTDIYTLGATMFHLLTGLAPAGQAMLGQPVGELLPQYAGSGLEQVLLKCCSYRPRDRYRNCGELMYALRHVHDRDKKACEMRKKRLRGFAACLLAALLFAGAGISLRAACANTRDELIRKNLTDAREQTSLAERIPYYCAAMTLDPGNPAAYLDLIEDVELEPELTEDIFQSVQKCIHTRDADPSSRKAAIDFLRDRDPSAYADFEFRLGTLVYLSCPSGKGNAARDFLSNALASGGLAGKRRAAAEMLYTLSSAYQEREKGRSESGQNGIAFEEGESAYWDALEKLTADLELLQAETGNAGYPVRVCDETANEMSHNAVRFLNSGISMERMETVLARIQRFMAEKMRTAPSFSPAVQEEIERVHENVQHASGALRELAVTGDF